MPRPKLLGDEAASPLEPEAAESLDPAAPAPQRSLEAAPPTVVESYDGQGGSYILDSTTGQRTLVHQTLPPSI